MSTANFVNSNISYANFYRAHIESSIFFNANARMIKIPFILSEKATFSSIRCINANFQHANLHKANFAGANARETIFTNVYLLSTAKFVGSNLRMATFTDTDISIQDVKLPSGMLGTVSSLPINGNPDCNRSVENIWKLSDPESIIVVLSNNDKVHCIFTRKNNTKSAINMTQVVNITNSWNLEYWNNSQAILIARLSTKIKISLIGITSDRTFVEKVTGESYSLFI
ncbi:unnamed protein product [Rotaria socialis]|uniref:Pentapeptide repeat-containing protein n=1 Tax=Rotaria socialis TaxID=392032 RepID=A0A818E0E8_9BILA|nr:unnamed protein product [Rotaria socialis]CAF4569580.1 unnamed protein product [Rotaria socialis]